MRTTQKALRKQQRRSRKGNTPDVNAARFSNTSPILWGPLQRKIQTRYVQYESDRLDHLRQDPAGYYGINDLQRFAQQQRFAPVPHLSNRGFFRSLAEGLAHFLSPTIMADAARGMLPPMSTETHLSENESRVDDRGAPALVDAPRHQHGSSPRWSYADFADDADAALAKKMTQTVIAPLGFTGTDELASKTFSWGIGADAATPYRSPAQDIEDSLRENDRSKELFFKRPPAKNARASSAGQLTDQIPEAASQTARRDIKNIKKRDIETTNPEFTPDHIKHSIFSGSGSATPNPGNIVKKAINELKSKHDFAKWKISENGLNPNELLTYTVSIPTDADYHERNEETTFCTMTRADVAVNHYMGAPSSIFARANLAKFKNDYWPSDSEYEDYSRQFTKELSRSAFDEIFSELQKFGIELNTDVTVISVNANMEHNAPRNPTHRIAGSRGQIFAFTRNGETHFVAISPLDKDTTTKIPTSYKDWVEKNPYRFFFNQEDVGKATGFFTEFKHNHKTASMALHELIYSMVPGITQSLSDLMNQETPLEKYIHNMRGFYDITGIYSIYRAIKTHDHKTLSIYIGDSSAGKLLSFAKPLKHVFVRLKSTALNVGGLAISTVANVYMVVDATEGNLQDICPRPASQHVIAGSNDAHTHGRKKHRRRRPQHVVTARPRH